MPALRKIPQVYKNRGHVGCGVCVIPPTNGNVTTITITKVDSISTTSARVFFTHPLYITQFTITYNGSSVVVGESPVVLHNLTPQTEYSVVVTGDLHGSTLTSNTFMFLTGVPPPTFIYYNSTNTTITIYFTAVLGQQLYVAGIVDTPTEFTSFTSPITITGLTPNSTYQIYLLTRDPNGKYPDSDHISYKMNTYPSVPQILSADPYITSVYVNYKQLPNYDLYYLLMDDHTTQQQVTDNPVFFTNVPSNKTQNLYEIADDSTGQYGRVISDPKTITTYSEIAPPIIITSYNAFTINGVSNVRIFFTMYPLYTNYTLHINGSTFTATDSPIFVTGLTPNRAYFAYIHSHDSRGIIPDADGPTSEIDTPP